jgi:hypothetical protein
MVSMVLLPDPLGPITATSSPRVDRQVDALQGMNLGSSLAVDLADLSQLQGSHDRTPNFFVHPGIPWVMGMAG